MDFLFGADMPLAVRFFFAFVIVLALIGGTAFLVRRFGGERLGASSARGRQPRLAVIDAAAVDGRRRLILIRRDNVEHLLMMRPGLEGTSNRNYGAWVTSRNWVQHALARPMFAAPGEEMEYSTGNTHLLSAILTQAAGQSTWQFANETLAKPLGFSLAQWPRDPQGIFFGGNDMLMTPRQMLAFGELYLNDGLVNGQRVLPARPAEVHWVGTSMGGIIGMLLAAQPGSPIRRLVLNDVGATIPWSALARLKGFVRRHEPYPSMREVGHHVRQMYAGFGTLTDSQWRHLARHSVTRFKDGGYRLAYDPAIEASLWNGSDLDMPIGLELVRGINLWRHWDAIRAPTLILRGAESDVLPRDVAREMLGRGPKASLVEFAGVGHAPALMAADQIDAVEAFLLG